MQWTQLNGRAFRNKDIKELAKQVNRFNNKVRRLEEKYKNDDILLPEILSTKELRKEIRTRKDLNDFYKSVNRFFEKGATQKVELHLKDNNIVNTISYEARELKINSNRAKRIISTQLKELEEIQLDKKTKWDRFTFAESDEKILKATLERLDLNKMNDIIDVNNLRRRALRYSTESRNFRKLEQYHENYLESLKNKYSYFPEFRKLYNKIKKLSPVKFYNLVKDDKILRDIQYQYKLSEWYREGQDISDDLGVLIDKWDKVLKE